MNTIVNSTFAETTNENRSLFVTPRARLVRPARFPCCERKIRFSASRAKSAPDVVTGVASSVSVYIRCHATSASMRTWQCRGSIAKQAKSIEDEILERSRRRLAAGLHDHGQAQFGQVPTDRGEVRAGRDAAAVERGDL